ncbi:MAG: hypothetical protein L6Q68_16130 [Aquabacterium sp.]|nr:hypothetical protein [Aquabacterium sp.]
MSSFRIAACALLVLAGCNGDDGTTNEMPAASTSIRSPLAQEPLRATASAVNGVPTTDQLLNWAEQNYPEYLPGTASTQQIDYEGKLFGYRCYASGNCVGVELATGTVFGLGPFTAGALTPLGQIADYRCRVLPESCTLPTVLSMSPAAGSTSVPYRDTVITLQMSKEVVCPSSGGPTNFGQFSATVSCSGNVVSIAPLNGRLPPSTALSFTLERVDDEFGNRITPYHASFVTAARDPMDLFAGMLGGPGWQDGAGTSARFSTVGGVARRLGKLYIADGQKDGIAIRVFDLAKGEVTTLARRISSKRYDFTGSTLGIAVDDSDNVLLLAECVLRSIDPRGNISIIAGTPWECGLTDGIGSAARLPQTNSMARDSAGNLYIWTGGAVLKVAAGGVVTTVVAGLPSVVASGVAVDSKGNIFVGDWNATIRKIQQNGSVTVYAGNGQYGWVAGSRETAQFGAVHGLAIDASDNLYFGSSSAAIGKISPQGDVSLYAGTPMLVGTADGDRSTARIQRVDSLTVGDSGELWFADGMNTYTRLRRVGSDRSIRTVAGQLGGEGYANGDVYTARFRTPFDIAADSAGVLYVAEFSGLIRRIDKTGQVTDFAGSPTESGYTDGPVASARFGIIKAITVGPDDAVFVLEKTRLRKVSRAGIVTTVATGFSAGSDVTVSRSGAIVVADFHHCALIGVAPDGTKTDIVGRTGQCGSDDGPSATARIINPESVAFDGDGNLFFSERETLRRVTPTGVVTTIAGRYDEVGHDDGVGTSARFNTGTSWAIFRLETDSAGNVYAVNPGSGTVRRISASSVVTTVAGHPETAQVVLGKLPGGLRRPTGLAIVEGQGQVKLLVVDVEENSVVTIAAP